MPGMPMGGGPPIMPPGPPIIGGRIIGGACMEWGRGIICPGAGPPTPGAGW